MTRTSAGETGADRNYSSAMSTSCFVHDRPELQRSREGPREISAVPRRGAPLMHTEQNKQWTDKKSDPHTDRQTFAVTPFLHDRRIKISRARRAQGCTAVPCRHDPSSFSHEIKKNNKERKEISKAAHETLRTPHRCRERTSEP